MKLAYPAFAVAKANAKGKCCERRRRSRAQCLSACTGVVDLYDSGNVVGMVDRESFSFLLADPLFPYAGNSSHNQQRM